jgi:hypothetical protein
MDDLTLIRSFRAERADDDPRARAAAWRALEARFDPTPTTCPATPARPPRRGLLALAGVAALSAIVAGLFVLSSGPTAEPAAAEALRRIAGVAADSPPESRPGPGQFIYKKTKTLELEGWFPDGRVSHGNPLEQPGAFAALVPADHEYWASLEGTGRLRETTGTPQFLSNAEQARWEQAGSPLPGPSDPSGKETIFGADVHVLEARQGMIDIERLKPMEGLGPNFGFTDLSGLPTEPEALRRTIEKQAPTPGPGPGGKPLGIKDMILPLWGILQQPIVDPELRAAVFNALSELPGIELDRDATDLVGRAGYAIGYVDQETGLRSEYIFDPETSEILGERSMLAGPGQTPAYEGLPVGVTISDVAYLRSEVVDSTREPNGDGQGEDPVATTGPVYRR